MHRCWKVYACSWLLFVFGVAFISFTQYVDDAETLFTQGDSFCASAFISKSYWICIVVVRQDPQLFTIAQFLFHPGRGIATFCKVSLGLGSMCDSVHRCCKVRIPHFRGRSNHLRNHRSDKSSQLFCKHITAGLWFPHLCNCPAEV